MASDRLGKDLDEALRNREWKTAFGLLDTWCDLHPDNAQGWYWKAFCLLRLGRKEEAAAAAIRAHRLNPNDRKTLELKARLDGAPHSSDSHAPKLQANSEDDVLPTLGARVETADDHGDSVPPTLGGGPLEAPVTRTGGPTAIPESTTTQFHRWREGSIIQGRYQVRKVLRGGMGEVYFLFDRDLAVDVAVKTPLPAALATENGRARFFREAEAWIGLGLHPNICAAYYVREIGGAPRLFIEYVDGGSLDAWLSDRADIDVPESLDLAIQIASGMHHAHTFAWRDEEGLQHRGVVHRDLKPANVLIGSDGLARVTDFGLVGRAGDPSDIEASAENAFPDLSLSKTESVWGTMTIGGKAMGTPLYMPPEQWDGAHLAGEPADIYAFGCTLYELFCGRRPFSIEPADARARPEIQLMRWEELHRTTPAPDPRHFRSDIDPDLADLMRTCLAKNPAGRPESFAQIRRVLADAYQKAAGRPYPRPEPKAGRLLADALNNRGVSFANLGRRRGAESAWSEALQADPNHLDANYNLSLFRWLERGASDADTLARMIEVRKGQGKTWRADHLLGRVCLRLGDWQGALNALRSAAVESNGAPEVARDCALALLALDVTLESDALRQEAVRLIAGCGGPLRRDPTLLTAYSLAQIRLGKIDEAGRLYDEARKRDPGLPHDLDRGARRLLPGQNQVRRLQGSAGRVIRSASSRDGRLGAAVLRDGRIAIWDLSTGALIRTLSAPEGRPRSLAVTPDGTQFLTASQEEPITAWDLEKGLVSHRLHPHPGFINALSVTADGRRAVGVGTTGRLFVWDLAGRGLVGNHHVHSGFLSALAVAADCRTVIVGGNEGKCLVADLVDGEIHHDLTGHQGLVGAVALSSGARRAASAGENGDIRVWDLATGCCRLRLQGHIGAVTFLSLSDDGNFCISAGVDGSLRHWDAQEGRPIASQQLGAAAFCGSATPDWGVVLLGHGEDISQLRCDQPLDYRAGWAVSSPVSVGDAVRRASDYQEKLEAARSFAGQENFAAALDMIEEARSVAGYERMGEILDLVGEIAATFPREGLRDAWEERILEGHGGRVNAFAVSQDGRGLLTAGSDHTIRWWTLQGEQDSRLLSRDWSENSIGLLPDGATALSGGLDNTLHLWNLEDGSCSRVFSGHEAQVNRIRLTFDGRQALSGSADGTIRLWDIETGVCLLALDAHGGEVFDLALSPDGRFSATAGDNGIICWDLRSGREVAIFAEHSGAVTALEWSLDGRQLLSAGRDGDLRLWDLASGSCVRVLHASGPLTATALSPDGRYALSGAADGEVRLWDLQQSTNLRVFSGHKGTVTEVGFTPDGRRVLSAGADADIRVRHLDWKVSVVPFVDWNDKARPHLEVFLARRDGGGGKLRWGRQDLEGLVADLGRRGLGWIRVDGVQRKLREMTAEWPGQTRITAKVLERAKRRLPATRGRQKQILIRRRWAVLVAVALVPILIFASHEFSRSRLDFNEDRIQASRLLVFETTPPPFLDPRAAEPCRIGDLGNHLRIFTKGDADPPSVEQARLCLEILSDPTSVGPVLDVLRSPDAGPRPDIFALLSRMDDATCPALAAALLDENPVVRGAAANALSFRGSRASIATLVSRASDPEPLVRIAVAATLEQVVASGRLERAEAFALFEKLAGDIWPEVRANVARALPILQGSDPRKLGEKLAKDRDEKVRDAARQALLLLR